MEDRTMPAVPAEAAAATPHEEALILHNEILCRQEIAAGALADFCQSLKRMRDSALYRELGCDSFESYCESRAGIKSRMAYNYIAAYERLGEDYMRRNATLGITKLEVLSRLTPEDREEIAEDAGDMSVTQLKELQEKLSVSGRQIEMLTEELEAANGAKDSFAQSMEALKAENSEKLLAAEARIEKLTSELAAAKKKVVAPAAVSEEDKKKIRDEAMRDARTELDGKNKAALEKSKAEAVKAKERFEKLENEKRAAEAEIERLKKQIASSDATVSRVKVYFNSIQDDFNKMCSAIDEADAEVRAKLMGAAGRLLEACRETLQSIAR